MQQVVIKWIDSRSEDGWTEQEELDVRLAQITTVGFLVSETDDMLVVAGSVDEVTKQVSGVMFIPVACVTDRWKCIDVVPLEKGEQPADQRCEVCRFHHPAQDPAAPVGRVCCNIEPPGKYYYRNRLDRCDRFEPVLACMSNKPSKCAECPEESPKRTVKRASQ